MRGYELALERLLRERDKLLPEERPPEMLLLIESLQAAEKAAEELEEAAAILREHPLPAHGPLRSIAAEQWQAVLAALDASPAAPVLFKGLVHSVEAAAKSLDATRSNSPVVQPVGNDFTVGHPHPGTPISALQLLASVAFSIARRQEDEGDVCLAAAAAGMLWPQDFSPELAALEAQHWVPSFPATEQQALQAQQAQQAQQPGTQLAAAMAGWLAAYCPEVRLADLQQWAFTLRTSAIAALRPDKRPARHAINVLCEAQRLLTAGASNAAWVAAGAWQVAKWWQQAPSSAARNRRLEALLEGVRDRATADQCWLLAEEAVSRLASMALWEVEERAKQRRQRSSVPGLTQRAGKLLEQSRQLLNQTKAWLPARIRAQLLNGLRHLEDAQRAWAHAVGARRAWQGERPKLPSKRCSGCTQMALHLRKCAQCQVATYCSRDCQVRYWKEGGHKAECTALAERNK